jgi:hypothetical protein
VSGDRRLALRARGHARARSLLVAVSALVLFSGLFAASSAGSSATYRAPSSIPADCSVDVTQQLLDWIASVPNNSTLTFPAGACYRVDGTLLVRNRTALTFEGNGATFKAGTTGGSNRAHWQLVDGSGLTFRDMKIYGPRSDSGFVYDLQWQHAFDVRGTAMVRLERVSASWLYGDCFYLGQGWDSRKAWASDVRIVDSSCSRNGRMGVAVTAAQDVVVQGNAFDQIGLSVFDVEPNGTGWGARNVAFAANKVGVTRDYIFVVTGAGPVDGVSFSGNTVVGNRMKVGAFAWNGERRSNITVADNTSDTGYYEKNGAAMRFRAIDGVTVTGNYAPLASPDTVLAEASDSCAVQVSGNQYPGGVAEARIAAKICGFAPGSGAVGATVEVAGAGFTGTTAVTFDGTAASFAVAADGNLAAVVPSGATTGAVIVTTPSGSAQSSTEFEVTSASEAPPAEPTASTPEISSFTPQSGPSGTRVVVAGTRFTGATAVAFGGVLATFTVESDSRITTFVPRRAKTGKISVKTPAGTGWSTTRFRVTKK